MLEIVGVLVVLGLLVFVARFLQRRADAEEGPLFSGPSTRKGRVVAFLLAIPFTAIALSALAEGRILSFPFLIPGLVGAALLLYAFGAEGLLRTIQGDRDGDAEPDRTSDER